MEVVLGYIGVMGLIVAVTWKKYPWPRTSSMTRHDFWYGLGAIVVVLLGYGIIHAL
jgi:hypothetical protein